METTPFVFTPFDSSILQPGDILLYFVRDFIDEAIAEKTGKDVGHIERYIGNGKSIASRNGIGVDEYPLRLDGLVCVRRPRQSIDFDAGMAWFAAVKGQGYDFEGLLTFTSFVKRGQEGKQFCSEFALNWDRAAKFEGFNPDQPSFETSPRDYWLCGLYSTVWAASADY